MCKKTYDPFVVSSFKTGTLPCWLYHYNITGIGQLNRLLAQHLEKDCHTPHSVLRLTLAEVTNGQMPVG